MTAPASTGARAVERESSLWARWLNCQRVHVPAGDLRVLRTGRGPTVMLLHALRTQIEYFIPLLDALDRDIDIVVPDLPGHGRSSAPEVDYTAGYLTGAVEHLLDRFDLSNVFVVGESIGASIGLGLAARRNNRVAGVVAINPYDHGMRGGVATPPGTVGSLRRMMEAGLYDPRNLPSCLVDEMWESGQLAGHANAFLSLSRHWESWIDERAAYPRAELPITLVYGDHDWSRPEDRDANSRALRTARTVSLANCGHFSSLDQPRQVARILREHISLARPKGVRYRRSPSARNTQPVDPRNNGDHSPAVMEEIMATTLTAKKTQDLVRRRESPLATPTDLKAAATKDISAALNGILADVFALYLKTKNFHWHLSGPHFRDYHLLFDEHADQIYEMADPIAERVRKLGGLTIRSIGEIARTQRLSDNDADYVEPSDMIAELREDNQRLVASFRQAHNVCEEHGDIATASLIEVWVDETERRIWFLFEASRHGDSSGR